MSAGVAFVIAASLILAACRDTAPATSSPTVQVHDQVLLGTAGTRYPTVSSFKGIPFAAPPVGDLRWREPQPPLPRSGVQQAKAFAPGCYQDDYNTQWYRKVGAAFGADASRFVDPPFSEDCLYLNVWTPERDKGARLPVMVWFYGGSNKAGWTYEPNYIGENLAARGNVIVVTVAYRVGVFGFFSHPDLRSSNAPANFGLLDQVAALRWLRDNVAAFGGDPANVTLFGESAGASDIGYLVSSPAAAGLFRRAISQSGGFQMQDRYTLGDAEQEGRLLSQALPEQPNLATLRRLPSNVVWSAAVKSLQGFDYAPVIDDRSVLQNPASAYSQHGIAYDLLVGHNADEWYMYFDAAVDGLAADLATFPTAVRPALAARASAERDVRTGRDSVYTLVNIKCPAYLMAAAAATTGHASWVYRFSRVRPGPGGVALRSYHGAEIPYVFDTHDDWLSRDATDERLTTQMIEAWSNFARTGNPNPQRGNGGAGWPRFDAANPQVMELGERIGSQPAVDHDLCRRIAPEIYPGWAQHN